MFNFKVATRTTEQVVTTAETRDHLRLFGDTSDDTQIAEFILAATYYLEDHLGEFIGTTSVQFPLREFSDSIELPHRFVKGLTGFQYYNTAGVLTDVPAGNYLFDETGTIPRIQLRSDQTYPTGIDVDREYPVLVTYSAGLSDAQAMVEGNIRSAILLITSELYSNRESFLAGQTYVNLPVTAERLIRSYRRDPV